MKKSGVKISRNLVEDWFDELDYSNISKYSHKKVKWKCSVCEHIWETSVASRSAGRGCPFCANQCVHSDGRNSMRNTHPVLAVELKENNFGNADTLMAGTNKILPWKCSKCEHEWEAQGSTRLNHQCPACSGRVVHSDGRNSISTLFPELAIELIPGKYGDANTLKLGTNKKLNWQCSKCNNIWKCYNNTVRKGHWFENCPKGNY